MSPPQEAIPRPPLGLLLHTVEEGHHRGAGLCGGRRGITQGQCLLLGEREGTPLSRVGHLRGVCGGGEGLCLSVCEHTCVFVCMCKFVFACVCVCVVSCYLQRHTVLLVSLSDLGHLPMRARLLRLPPASHRGV